MRRHTYNPQHRTNREAGQTHPDTARPAPKTRSKIVAALIAAAGIAVGIAGTSFTAARAYAANANATGIYTAANNITGACTLAGAANPAGGTNPPYPAVDETQTGTGGGPSGTWAWLFDETGANPAGATFPPSGLTLGGPLAGVTDTGADAGASFDGAAPAVDPTATVDHTGSIQTQIGDFANAYPGPWTLKATLPTGQLVTGTAYTGTVTLQDATGQAVPVGGLPVNLTGAPTGLSVVDSSPTTSNNGTITYTLTATTPGAYTPTWTIPTVAAPGAPEYSPPAGSGYQTLLGGTTVSQSASVNANIIAATGTITITKTNGSGTPLAGATFSVTATGGTPTTYTTTANGTATAANLTPGSYTVTETAAPSGYTLPANPTQTATVTSGANTNITFSDLAAVSFVTQTAQTQVVTGGTLTDTITVTDTTNTPFPIQWTLYGPLQPAAGSYSCAGLDWSGAPVFATGSVQATTSANITTTPSPTITTAGCYTYAETAAATATTVAASTTAGTSTETTLAVTPNITTAISQTSITGAGDVYDNVTLTGDPGQSTQDATATLYGPLQPAGGSCNNLNWANAPTLGTVTFAITGPGTYKTPTVAIANPGCYSFAENIPAIAPYPPMSTSPGVATEIVLDAAQTAALTSIQSGLAGTRPAWWADLGWAAATAAGMLLVVMAVKDLTRRESEI